MIDQVTFLGLVVKDVAASTRFYKDTLGLAVNEKESIPDFFTQFDLNGGPTFGLLSGFEHEGIEQAFDAAIVVRDVDAAYTQLRDSGVDMVSEPQDMPFGRTFLFNTPDGHTLRLYSPLKEG